jgi:hypothetical protein
MGLFHRPKGEGGGQFESAEEASSDGSRGSEIFAISESSIGGTRIFNDRKASNAVQAGLNDVSKGA